MTLSEKELAVIDTSLKSILASQDVLSVLRDLHIQALTEPPYVSTQQPLSVALDKFVALDPDKCSLVYLLLRSIGARYVVEAGTSFGVSTIYLALAVGQNVVEGSGGSQGNGKVIATENEPTKATKARSHWASAGQSVEKWIELREGDLLETLKSDLPAQVDFLLLDIWTPLALPTLKIVQPKLRKGGMVVVDNILAAAAGYKDLTAYLADPANGFKTSILPYTGGLLLGVFVGADGV